MTTAPILPFAPDAFISDTMHLTAEETGAYLMLLFCQWRNNGEPLKYDPHRLARMCRITPRRFPKIWSEISCFFKHKDGVIWQQRLLSDYHFVNQKILLNRRNGSTGGKAKSLKYNIRPIANASRTLGPDCSERGSIPDTDTDTEEESKIEGAEKSAPKKPLDKPKGKPIAKRKSISQFIRENLKGSDDLPEDFKAYAQKWGHPEPDLEWEMFINTWLGNGDVKADWLATWRNRVSASKKAGWYTSRKPQNQYQQPDRNLASKTAHGDGLRKAVSMEDM